MACKNRTSSRVTCNEIGIKLLYKIMNVSKLYAKFALLKSAKVIKNKILLSLNRIKTKNIPLTAKYQWFSR